MFMKDKYKKKKCKYEGDKQKEAKREKRRGAKKGKMRKKKRRRDSLDSGGSVSLILKGIS